jgi:hypothetical protein
MVLNLIRGEKRRNSRNLFNRQSDLKNGTLIFRTDSFYLSVMPINNFFANSKTNSAALVFISAMQTEKRLKNTVIALRVETDTIILYKNIPQIFFTRLSDQLNFGSLFVLFKFDSIADQALEQLPHLSRVGLYRW